MPLYDFKCEHCGNEEELFRRLYTRPPKCPACGRSMVKLMSATSFILNGNNWERDGYGLRAKKKPPKKGDK